MFAKDHISMQLSLESTTFRPGQSIQGHFNVSVDKELECTAVRVKIECVQDTRVTVGSGKNRRTYHEQVYFVKHYITCYGFGKQNGRKGGCFLSPGTNYAYDFQYQLPYSAPGTVALSKQNCSGQVKWTVTGVVDIPNGFNKTMEQVIFVTTLAPSAQALSGPCVIAPISMEIASCGCTGCYCCSTGESIQVTPIVSHPIVLTADTYSNGERADVFGVRLGVENTSGSVELETARVVLQQVCTIRAKGCVSECLTVIGSCEIARATEDIQEEGYALFTTNMSLNTSKLVASVSTPLMATRLELVIDFPHSKVKVAGCPNCLFAATGEDTSNVTPPMPSGEFYALAMTEDIL